VAPPPDSFRAEGTVAAVTQPTPVSPAARPAPLSLPAVPAPTVERMFVQIGAFAQPENAERLAARLRASGFANPTVVSRPDNRRTLHRVLLGPVADSLEFDQLTARLRAIGVSGSRLVTASVP
jgi:rare lipoprotein A